MAVLAAEFGGVVAVLLLPRPLAKHARRSRALACLAGVMDDPQVNAVLLRTATFHPQSR